MTSEKNIAAVELPPPSILVVEDNPTDLLMLRQAFRKAHVANPLIEVRDGQEALQYLSAEGAYADRSRFPIPVLILLDLRLPKLSGFQVLEWIRDRSELVEITVVVLTASDYVEDVTQASRLGANSYLVKPRTFSELVELVKGIKGRWLVFDREPGRSVPRESWPPPGTFAS